MLETILVGKASVVPLTWETQSDAGRIGLLYTSDKIDEQYMINTSCRKIRPGDNYEERH